MSTFTAAVAIPLALLAVMRKVVVPVGVMLMDPVVGTIPMPLSMLADSACAVFQERTIDPPALTIFREEYSDTDGCRVSSISTLALAVAVPPNPMAVMV